MSNDPRSAYLDEGDKNGTPLILITGINQQLISWPDHFVDTLIKNGFRVIRFDNRDSGLSRSYDECTCPSFHRVTLSRFFGIPVKVPYSLQDMASDAVGLLDSLSLPKAHVIGISMGGMIAQVLTGNYPEKVLSLTSINSSTGKLGKGLPTLELSKAMISPTPKGMTPVENSVRVRQMFGSPKYPESDEEVRKSVISEHQRARNVKGYFRQMAAVRSAPNRNKLLSQIKVPTLIIHGLEDKLINVNGGIETKKYIKHANFVAFEGMGHNLPRELNPKFLELISDITKKGELYEENNAQ